MDSRKIIWEKQKRKRWFIGLCIIFAILSLAFYSLGKQGADVGYNWIISFVLSLLSALVAIYTARNINQLKASGNSAQKLRDCVYSYFREIREIGDSKVSVGLVLTIMDYYLSDEENAYVLKMAEAAKVKEKEELVKTGESIVMYIFDCFEKGEEGQDGRFRLSPAEKKIYDGLRREVFNTVGILEELDKK